MSVASIKSDLQLMRKNLQTAVNELNIEVVYDILEALQRYENQLTAELIKESKLGNIVNTARESFSKSTDSSSKESATESLQSKAKEIPVKARNILNTWRDIMKSSTQAPSPAKTAPSTIQPESNSKVEKVTISSSSGAAKISLKLSSDTVPSWTTQAVPSEKLNPQRQKAMTTLAEILASSSKGLEKHIATEIARQIEVAVNKNIPFDLDMKSYSAKFRSLAFNIKRNKNLSEMIISRALPVDSLVTMSANDLASEELMIIREQVAEKGLDNKRGDWYQAHRLEILETNGIDPNNVWSYDADNGSDDEPEIAGD